MSIKTIHHSSIVSLLAAAIILAVAACTPTPENAVTSHDLPPMYPDYTDITIPPNIAPLNFLLRNDAEAVELRAEVGDEVLTVNARGNEVRFGERQWHDFLGKAKGQRAKVTVTALKDGRWTAYKPFCWEVATDSIDPYLTYRLIEPDYEIFQNLSLRERCVEDFSERAISDYRLTGNRCMNCHTYANQSPHLSMLYVRGEGGGAMLNHDGKLTKLDIKTDGMVSGSVYFGFSPSGRYITFSTNVIIPAFHAKPSKRLEVFDSASDVYVADLTTHTVISCPLLADSTWLETFPTFAPDGKAIYFCSAPPTALPDGLPSMRYSLCRIAFDEQTGSFGQQVDTLYTAWREGHSVCHPRVSPDGRHIVYTIADYGTFPIWHTEADLQMMDLKTGEKDKMEVVNSGKSDTYHSWSSNSRWLVFASKRDDGLYGKPYFTYIDTKGHAHKPFVLPQHDPQHYDLTLKSFNAPEMGRGPLPFGAADVQRALQQTAIKMKP